MLTVASDRFERRLTEELAALRADFGRLLDEGLTGIRQEMATARLDMATARLDMLKWSFVFWIGQVAVFTGLVALMLRASGR